MFILDYFRNLSTHIDYVGQRHAERTFQILISALGIVGFLLGYAAQQLSIAVYTLGVGFVVACVIVLPPWPVFRRHPLKWQKAVEKPVVGDAAGSGAQKKKKK